MTSKKIFALHLAVFVMTAWAVRGRVTDKLPYKDPSLPTSERVADLVSRMTVEEKVGQVNCLQGWEMYEKGPAGVGVSQKFKDAVRDIIPGMMWATLRADPWTRKTLTTGLNPALAAEATNALQRYIIENTRLGIPIFLAEECPHGHMAIGATVFPTSIGQASTWDPELMRQMAEVIARETRYQGAHIGYGPVLDLAREPRWSRVEETYGEDPVLIAAMGRGVVTGFQSEGLASGRSVISTLKHFAAYGDPEGGHNSGAMSVGLRDLHQNYLHPFRAAVAAGALSVMSSYNSIDGIPCSSSEWLLTELLRGEWGFDGFTVSDLGSVEGIATTHRVARDIADASLQAITAGLDVDLGGRAYSSTLVEAFRTGKADMAVLDRAVARVLRLKFEMGLFENPYVDPKEAAQYVSSAPNRELAAQVARETVVLLKNEGDMLPLDKKVKNIAVIGPNADNIYNQIGDYSAPQARESVVTVLDGIRRKASPGTTVTYVKGCAIRDTVEHNIPEAVEAARKADVAVVVVGGSSARDFETEYLQTGAAVVGDGARRARRVSDMESGEGYDRMTLDLLGRQMELLRAVKATGTPMVVVYIQGRPLNMNWAAENAPALLCAWYPGGEGGTGIADVIFGDYNPAGRMPVSVPRSVGQLPVFYNQPRPAARNYVEGTARPLYSFGFGLSYTTFEYSDLKIAGAGDGVDVSFTLRNSGVVDGDEVVQLYAVPRVASVVPPVQQLRAFERLHLKAGEQKTVTLHLSPEDLAIWGADMKFSVEPGRYIFEVGGSSDKWAVRPII